MITHAPPDRQPLDDRRIEADIIRGTMRAVWPSLPALLVASAAICVAALVPVVVAPSLNPVAVLVAAVVCGPLLAPLAAVANEMSLAGHGTVRTWWRALASRWRFGLGAALVAAVPTALLLVAVEVWQATESALVVPSCVVGGIVSLIAVLALSAAVPLGVARPDLGCVVLWRTAVALVAARPARFAAVASVTGFGLWLSTTVSASLLLLVPAPTAIVAVTATWTTVAFAERTATP